MVGGEVDIFIMHSTCRLRFLFTGLVYLCVYVCCDCVCISVKFLPHTLKRTQIPELIYLLYIQFHLLLVLLYSCHINSGTIYCRLLMYQVIKFHVPVT